MDQNNLSTIISSDVNLDGVRKIVEGFANTDGTLIPQEEKKFAMDTVEDWKQNMLEKIANRCNDADVYVSMFESFVKPSTYYTRFSGDIEDVLNKLAQATGNSDKYETLKKAEEEYKIICASRVAPIDYDENDTIEEIEKKVADHSADKYLYRKKVDRANMKIRTAEFDLLSTLAKNPQVINFVDSMRSFKRRANHIRTQVIDLASEAKINITISNENLRNALMDMIKVTETL